MNTQEFTYTAEDGKTIAATRWLPDKIKPLKGVVQLVHGMAEHRKRYDDFAGFLARNGFAVFAEDHRGHGETIADPSEQGFFAETEGWDLVTRDLHRFSLHIRDEYPGAPFFLLGHSMGSFLARTLMIRYPELYTGVILSGTAAGQGLLGKAGKLIARGEIRKKGARTPNPLLQSLSFGSYNKAFRPNRTESDWLTRDEAIVDKTLQDPLCGFVCSSAFFLDLLNGVEFVNSRTNINRIPPELPVYLFSGDRDPVGDFGKGVTKVFRDFQAAGLKNLSMKLYPGARHETLNETNRQEVYEDVLNWLVSRL